MKCPICFGMSKIIRTAITEDAVYRRRFCLNCHNIFYTEERDLENPEQFEQVIEEIKIKINK